MKKIMTFYSQDGSCERYEIEGSNIRITDSGWELILSESKKVIIPIYLLRKVEIEDA